MVFRKPLWIWFWSDHCKFSMVFEETITIEYFSAVWPLLSMVFQWFLILLPSLSMVFDGSVPLIKRCDGFDGSLWSTPVAGLNVESQMSQDTLKIVNIGNLRPFGKKTTSKVFHMHFFIRSFNPFDLVLLSLSNVGQSSYLMRYSSNLSDLLSFHTMYNILEY